MKPIDNASPTIAAYSDWLEENNQLDLAKEIREESRNNWVYEFMYHSHLYPGSSYSDYVGWWCYIGGGCVGVGMNYTDDLRLVGSTNDC